MKRGNIMKTYKFGVNNWKNDLPPFWFYKSFPSAYAADRYAMRVSFKRGSAYMVWLVPGEEK